MKSSRARYFLPVDLEDEMHVSKLGSKHLISLQAINLQIMLFEIITKHLFETGIATPLIVIDYVLVLLLATAVKYAVVPAVSSYSKCQYIDECLGSDQRHWFYGHPFKVRINLIFNIPDLF